MLAVERGTVVPVAAANSPDLSVVPTVDISGWVGGGVDVRSGIAAAIDAACRTVGFMQVTGHGIDASVDSLTEAIDWFFDLPMDVKQQSVAPRPSINRGYTPPRSERLSHSLGVASPDDLFEAFNVGSSMSDFPDLDVDPEVYAENIWPASDGVAGLDGAKEFERNVNSWFDAAGGLARRMTEIFSVALGLPADHIAQSTDHSIDVLRLNHYDVPEGIELGEEQMGMGAHTDYGIVTVLWADAVPGLEILRPDGSWHPVVPAPGALLLNLGDLLARWTNDRWLSTMHRVVPPRTADGRLVRRRSAAFFHDGNADAVISTFAPCRDAMGSTSYDDVTVAEHLAQKLGGSRGLELNAHAEREALRISTPLVD